MFGLRVEGTSGHTNIDSSWFNLEMRHKIVNATPNYYSGGGAYYAFPSIVPTQRPPNVFIRMESSARLFIGHYIIIGRPGAWTGFYVVTGEYRSGKNFPHFYPIGYPTTRLSYIVATFPLKHNEQYGMEIYNESQQLVMSSSGNLIKLIGQTENFKSEGRLAHNWLWYSVPRPSSSFTLMQGAGALTRSKSLDIYLGLGHSAGESKLWMMVNTVHSGGPWYGYNPFLVVYAEDS